MFAGAMFMLTVLAGADAAPTYRLRGDALLLTQSPSGVIALSGTSRIEPWLSAEALIWAGAGDSETFDALVFSIQAKDQAGRWALRAGRLLHASGALRPLHFDGVAAVARAPWGTNAEFFGGAPVVPRFANRGGDWLVGGRVSQRVSTFGSVGVSIAHQTDGSEIAMQEVGLDLAVHPIDIVDVSLRGAYDLVTFGVSEFIGTGGVTVGAFRFGLRGWHRSPSRILPATSIFSVLGDVPSNAFLTTVEWRAAPRLDLTAAAGARVSDSWGEDLTFGVRLRLDDTGRGALGLRLTRLRVDDAGWTGARATIRVPLGDAVVVSTELELARTEKGETWPWGLAAVSWAIAEQWDVAAAVEASSSPRYVHSVQAIGRLSYRWSGS